MRTIRLGRTDMRVSVVSLGCWAFAGDQFWGEQDDADSVGTVHAALEAGVNFFDNAEGYGGGRAEEVLGRALVGRRDQAIIATKVSPENMAPAMVRKACEASLRRLQTDYIDLYQIHWPSRVVPLVETMETLGTLKQEGKIRAIGVSNFGDQDLDELIATGHVESNQLPYNLLWRAIEFDVRQKCMDAGMGILCYSPLMQALLTGKYAAADDVPDGRSRSRHFSAGRPLARHGEPGFEAETFAAIERIRELSLELGQPMGAVSMAWLLQQPGVTSVITGARTAGQIRRNAEAAEVALAEEVVSDLSMVTEDLKRKLGPDPDLWQSPSRFR